MSELYKNISRALNGKRWDIFLPEYIAQDIISVTNQTRTLISIILPSNKDRIIEDFNEISRCGAENLELALRWAKLLLKIIIDDYNKKIPFQFDPFFIEDDEFVVRLKSLINRLLIEKTKRLFISERDLAFSIKTNQIAYLNASRYPWYEKDLKEWFIKEIERRDIIEYQDRERNDILEKIKNPDTWQSAVNLIDSDKPIDLYIWEKYTNEELMFRNDRLSKEFDNLYNAWEYYEALLIWISQLVFFTTVSIKNVQISWPVYDCLVLPNLKYIKDWMDKIKNIPEKFDVLSPPYLAQKIKNIIWILEGNDMLPNTIIVHLKKILNGLNKN